MKSFPMFSACAAIVVAGTLATGAANAQVAPAITLPAMPVASPAAAPTPAALTVGRVPVEHIASSDQADAEAFVSLARFAMETCGPIGDQPPVTTQQRYAGALADYLAHRYPPAIAASKAIVTACSAAGSVAP